MGSASGISPAELAILTYILDHHPATVRDVADHFARTNEYARTTVLTLMERLRQKGYLEREEGNGVHRYTPLVHKADLQHTLVKDFVERSLGGSLSPFVAFLSQGAKLSSKEIAELKALVDDMGKQPKGSTE
jgi:predicted transcriptional regulator